MFFYSYPWIKLFIVRIFQTVISIDLLRLLLLEVVWLSATPEVKSYLRILFTNLEKRGRQVSYVVAKLFVSAFANLYNTLVWPHF